MGKQRANIWVASFHFVGAVIIASSGCAAGNEPELGNGGGGDVWGGGGASGSGTGGMGGSASSSSSTSGSPCGGPETCNGKDDDCNGLVDDDVAAVGNPCNTGMMGVCGVGAVDCQNGSPICKETNSPGMEVCDNLDNDCNGQIDDGNPGGGDTCATGLPGPCGAGTITCAAGAFLCAPQVQAAPEVCGDNIDDDCDGTPDDGCGGMGGACSHSPCEYGAPLATNCAPCVTVICNIDSYCCTDLWDFTCTAKAADKCPGC